jgi:hypothetical protein
MRSTIDSLPRGPRQSYGRNARESGSAVSRWKRQTFPLPWSMPSRRVISAWASLSSVVSGAFGSGRELCAMARLAGGRVGRGRDSRAGSSGQGPLRGRLPGATSRRVSPSSGPERGEPSTLACARRSAGGAPCALRSRTIQPQAWTSRQGGAPFNEMVDICRHLDNRQFPVGVQSGYGSSREG